jgi:DeoR/GlpR family transcriptional regulator of sugar metabolism
MAAELIRDGEAVVVDSGTSGLAAARALADRQLSVMPLSLHSAVVLSVSSSVNMLLSRGATRFGEGAIVGPLAEASLAALRFDTVLLPC